MQGDSTWTLDHHGQVYPIPPQGLRIGRGHDNDIVIADDQISRHHALVWNEQGVIYLRDEGSTNGTLVNGKRIAAPAPLRAHDRVQVGRAVLSVQTRMSARAAIPRRPRSNKSILVIAGAAMLALTVLLIVGVALGANSAATAPTPVGQVIQTAIAEPAMYTPAPMPSPLPTAMPTARVTATPAPIAAPTMTRATAPAANPVPRALLATVLVIAPIENTKLVSAGSGTIVNARGFVLTNYHVVRDEDTGKPLNSQDRVWVYVNSATDRPPDLRFRAQVVELDSNLDLALLQITATADGGQLPSNLGLMIMPIGNSDTVNIGDPIRVLGFPSTGGTGYVDDLTITLTEGIVSGFLENRSWIKTAAEISGGNSGGAAINASGELIGIPTSVRSDRSVGGKIGYIRPVNLAKSVLAKAR